MKFRVLVIATLVMSAVAVAAVGLGAPPHRAAAQECDPSTGSTGGGTTVEVGCGHENGPSGGGGPSGEGGPSGGGGLNAAQVCAEEYPNWGDCESAVRATGLRPSQICGHIPHYDQSLLGYYHPEAPPGSTLLYFVCPRDGVYYTEDTQVGPPGGAAPPPSPAEVAADLWVEVQATLLEPDPVSSPPEGTSAIIEVPTFVAVANWQGEIVEDDCQQGVCVTLTATPALTFEPAEPDAPVVACAGAGTVYDPGRDPDAQASEPGACAYTYIHRTSRDRGAWPGTVNITWTVTWVGEDEQGGFDPLTLSADLPRQVDEVQGVVIGGNPGLGE